MPLIATRAGRGVVAGIRRTSRSRFPDRLGGERCNPAIWHMTEALDARHFGLGALAAAVGYAVVLFIDATLLARVLVWLSWMLLVSAVGYFALPPWREVPVRKALAGRILVAEAAAVVVLATAIRIATA